MLYRTIFQLFENLEILHNFSNNLIVQVSLRQDTLIFKFLDREFIIQRYIYAASQSFALLDNAKRPVNDPNIIALLNYALNLIYSNVELPVLDDKTYLTKSSLINTVKVSKSNLGNSILWYLDVVFYNGKMSEYIVTINSNSIVSVHLQNVCVWNKHSTNISDLANIINIILSIRNDNHTK